MAAENITAATKNQLHDLENEVKQLRCSIVGLERTVLQQSVSLKEIHTLLKVFGEGLNPVLQSFLSKDALDKGEHRDAKAPPETNTTATKPRQRKMGQAKLATAKSFHSFQSQIASSASSNPGDLLTASESSSEPNQLIDESKDDHVKSEQMEPRSNRASSFRLARDKAHMWKRTRSKSVNCSIATTDRPNRSQDDDASLKKMSCESGIAWDDDLLTTTGEDSDCVNIELPVPYVSSRTQESETLASKESQHPATIPYQNKNDSNEQDVQKHVAETLADINQGSSLDKNGEGFLTTAAISEDTSEVSAECIFINAGANSLDDDTKPLEYLDKDQETSTSQASSDARGMEDKAVEGGKQLQSEQNSCGNVAMAPAQDKEISMGGIEKNVMESQKLKTTEIHGRRLSAERVYSCSDLNAASSPLTRSLIADEGIGRQHSNSSTASADSAPPRFQGKLPVSESEEEADQEIVISPMPSPAFAHRAVQVKNTSSKYFYELKDQIGGGRFGRVYRCNEKKTGLLLAAKCFKCKRSNESVGFKARSLNRPVAMTTKRTEQEPVDKADVRHEISVMNSIDHENIVKLYDAFEHENTMTLILEYMDGGEMFERVLADVSQLTEFDAVLYMQQISKAMQYLHKNLILHLDLKPENIICIDRTSHHIKIIDFGLARKYNPRQKLMVHWGTPEFMAPEVLNYEHVSAASDMWSVGVITHILLSGLSPFLGSDDKETIQNIIDAEWEFDDDHFEMVSDDAKDFISRLLVEEKRGRMSAAQCLRHDWLAKPLTTQRTGCLQSKRQLKTFMARTNWKVGIAAVSAANWLFRKSSNKATIDGTSV